jgi:hypothetical protein
VKPHIRLRFNVWDCRDSHWHFTGIVGYGYRPDVAYRDWLRQMVQHGRMR